MQAHRNNVGLLRLLLASLVIVGHAPEQIDGNRLREPLTAIFPYPALNGSMWTIAYEFRCYLLVALLGVAGLLNRRWAVLALTSLAMLGLIAETFAPVHAWSDAFDARWRTQIVIGGVAETIRLTAVFLVGACIYLFREEIFSRLNGRVAAVCAVGAVPLLFLPHLAEAALVTLGAIALFWLAFRANIGPLQRINDSWDVSYGVYLYGWMFMPQRRVCMSRWIETRPVGDRRSRGIRSRDNACT